MATTYEERTTSNEDEMTRQDDNLRGVCEDLRGVCEDKDRTVETEMTKDEATDEKTSVDEEIKNGSLNNDINLSNHIEMNAGITSCHTAVLQQLQTRLEELGSDKDGEILALIERLDEEHQKEIETVQKLSDRKFLKEDGQHECEEMSKVLNETEFLKSKHKEEMEELRRTLEDEYQKQVLKISDELRDHYQNDINEKMTKLEEEWELEFVKQKREFDERVTAVQKEQWSQCHDAIERVTLDAEDQLKNMKHAYDSETAEQKRRIQELLEERALFEMKEKELDEEKYQKENESFKKIKTLEKQLSTEREEVEYQINGAQNEIEKMKNEHRKETEDLKTELEKKYSIILNETRNGMKEKYQKELDEKVQRVKSHLQEEYEQDLEKTKEELRESSITLKSKYEKQLSEVVSELEELHERNQQHELQEAKLKKDYETEKKKVEELEKDVEKKWKDIQAEKTKDHDLEIQTILKDNEDETSRQVLEEKKSLKAQLDEVSSQLLIMKEKENEKNDELKIKSYEEEIAKLKTALELQKASEEQVSKLKTELEVKKANEEEVSTFKKELELRKASEENASRLQKEMEEDIANKEEEIFKLKTELEVKKASEEEVSKFKKELELRKASEENASKLQKEMEEDKANKEEEICKLKTELEIKKASEEEVSKFKKELELKKATINELEELSRARELEIANLILHSPVTSDEVNNEFEFSGKPEDKIDQLEIEIAKYKKKIMELEEEAEDKFETTLCQNCEDGETREEIISKAKALMEKIENDCMEKVEDLTKKLEKSEEMLKKQTTVSKDLEEKLSKVKSDLKKEMNRSMELSKLNKHFDLNRNVLQLVNTETQTLDGNIGILKDKVGSDRNDEDISAGEDDSEKLQYNSYGDQIEEDEKLIEEDEKLVEEKDSEISEKDSEISKKDYEISEKDYEISKITNENGQMRALVETLKKRLRQGEKKYEQLTIRAMDQKSNYESEIELMQKEIEALIQENKDQEKKQNMSESILQEKIEKLETVMAESFSKHREEIAKLNEIIEEKKRRFEDLEKKQQAVETSRKEIDTNIENLKKEFEEKERELLNEIQEKTASFQQEKNEILGSSFQEKEELLTRIADLEKQCKDSNIWPKSDEESEISYSTSNERRQHTEARETPLSDEDRPPSPQDLSMTGHDRINRDNREMTRGEVQYQEHISSPLEDHPRYNGILEDKRGYNSEDNEGYEGIVEDNGGYGRIWEDNEEYEGILKDKMGYTGITDDGREESSEYDINGYGEREDEKEKYQMEIELLVEKEEKERLKQELGTMTTCVDVFHDECQHLKSTLDKALDTIKIIKRERDDLVEQSHRSLDEHSEIMLELIKYEEVIKKLEMGNEKLEKEMLQQYLNEDKTATRHGKIASEREYSTKSNPEIHTTFPAKNERVKDLGRSYSRIARNKKYFTKPNREIQKTIPPKQERVKVLGDTKIKTEIQEMDCLMEELEKELETREGPSNDDEDHLAKLVGYKNKLQKKPVETSMLNTFASAENDWEQVERKNNQGRNERERKNNSSFLQTRFSGYQSHEDKTSELSRNHNQHMAGRQTQEQKYSALSRGENAFLLEDQPGSESDSYVSRFPWKRQDSTTSRKHVTFTRDDHSKTPEHKDVMSASSDSMAVDWNQFPSRSTHVERQLSTEAFYRKKYRAKNIEKRNVVKKNGKKSSEKSQVAEEDKLCRWKSWDSSRIARKMTTTPFTSISQESASTISSSFLTSTRTNSALHLVPNLSGLSPIVSELERRRHEEMLRWQVAVDLPRDPSSDHVDTTILTTADPFGFQQARTPPNFGNSFARKTKQKSGKKPEKHVRSRSADDRLFRSPGKLPSFKSRDDSYAEKPLTINFEDYVIRHRVKSSEDVANLRDPSPAELWLY